MEKIMIIGLTGQSGAGKTILCEAIGKMGIEGINCDLLAKKVLETNEECSYHIKQAFPKTILNLDGSINRQSLATLVFENPEQLKRLNMLIFPYIIASLKQEIAFLRKLKPTAIVLDAPTLFESRADYLCDYKISIIAQKKIRIQRIMARDGLSLEQAHHRIDAQHTDDYYREQSDYTLCNHGDIPSFLEKAKSLLNQIILSYNNSNKMLK